MSDARLATGIHQLAIPCQDVPRATAFYRDALGIQFLFDFPVTPGAIQSTFHGKIVFGPETFGDGFVTKVDAGGSGLVYSTYLGGANRDVGTALALDGAGNAYVTGITESADFPTTLGVLHATFIGPPPIMPGSGGNGF